MPKRERTGVICRRDGDILALEQQDPMTRRRFWTFPGGMVEEGESPEECAVRETLEETGYTISLESPRYTNHYDFRWNGRLYACTTHWYLASPDDPDPQPVDDADYIMQSMWLPWPGCRPLFTFNRGLVDAVDTLL